MKRIEFNSLPIEKQNDIIELLKKINLSKQDVHIYQDGYQLKARVKTTGEFYTLLFD